MKNNSIYTLGIAIIVILILTSACTTKTTTENIPVEAPRSYCIALDLSDRIANPSTVDKDIASVMQVFASFEERVKKAHYIKNQDRFNIVLVPQSAQHNAHELNLLVSELSIDMQTIPVKKRYEYFMSFKQNLVEKLQRIYQLAKQPDIKDYYGCNIWMFLNDQLPDILEASNEVDFKLILLTDCYIEIDNTSEIFERNGQTNHMNSNMMARLRKNDYWKNDPCDILLLPERLCKKDLSKLTVVVAGLASHNTYPYETQLLEKVWESFLRRMSLDCRIISYSNGTSVVSQNLSDALM